MNRIQTNLSVLDEPFKFWWICPRCGAKYGRSQITCVCCMVRRNKTNQSRLVLGELPGNKCRNY